MFFSTVIGWIVAGLIVGAVARFLVPGRQSMGLVKTIVLGIVGALVGGVIGSLLFGPPLAEATGTYAVETAWPGWVMAVVGGVLVLAVYLTVGRIGNRNTTRLP